MYVECTYLCWQTIQKVLLEYASRVKADFGSQTSLHKVVC